MKTESTQSVMSRIMGALKNQKVAVAVLFIMTLVPFLNVFGNGFIMDDHTFLTGWPLIRDWANLPRFFVNYIPPEGAPEIYAPFKTVFCALFYHLFGEHPFGYHLIAIVVHLAGTWTVYRLCRLLTENRIIAFMGGLLFGIHPVQTESVTYMAAGVDTLGGVFMLASFYFFVRSSGKTGVFAEPESILPDNIKVRVRESALDVQKPSDYAISVLFAALAVFTHELTLSLPVLFWFYDTFFGRIKRTIRQSAARLAPFAAVAVLYLLIKVWNFGEIFSGHYLFGSFYLSMMLMIKVMAKYVLICLFPVVLTHNHIISPGIFSFDEKDFSDAAVLTQSLAEPHVLVSMLFLTVIVITAVKHHSRKPLVSFSTGWFFISLLPVSGLIPGPVYFDERFLYPGSAGFCLLAAWLIHRFSPRAFGASREKSAALAGALFLAVVLGCSARIFLRNRDYRDEISWYASAVRSNPQSAYLKTDLGIVYHRTGQYEKAIELFSQALALKPDNEHIYFSMAPSYSGLGRLDEAAEIYKKAIAVNPDFAEAYFNLASLYAGQRDETRARYFLSKARAAYKRQGRIIEAGQAVWSLERYLHMVKEPDTGSSKGSIEEEKDGGPS